jgi:Domain of unknown function (DUF6916)
MTTRRELLVMGSMAGVRFLLPEAAHAALRRPERVEAAQDGLLPTREQLAAQLNTSFVVQREDARPVRLVLVGVAEPALAGGRRHPGSFRAVFRGPHRALLGQNTYAVTNDALGEFPLFLVPVGRADGATPIYEAAFNRL